MTPEQAADFASALLITHDEARNAWRSQLKIAADASRDESGTPAERLALYKELDALKLAMQQAEQAIIAAAPALLDAMYWHEQHAAVYMELRARLMVNNVPYTPPAPPLPPRPTAAVPARLSTDEFEAVYAPLIYAPITLNGALPTSAHAFRIPAHDQAPVLAMDGGWPINSHDASTPSPDADQDESLWDEPEQRWYVERDTERYRLKVIGSRVFIEQQAGNGHQALPQWETSLRLAPVLADRYWVAEEIDALIILYKIALYEGIGPMPIPRLMRQQQVLAALRHLDSFDVSVDMSINGRTATAPHGKTITETVIALALALEENGVKAP